MCDCVHPTSWLSVVSTLVSSASDWVEKPWKGEEVLGSMEEERTRSRELFTEGSPACSTGSWTRGLVLTATRKYSPLRGLTSRSCGRVLDKAKKELFTLFVLILSHFWCSVVTSVT